MSKPAAAVSREPHHKRGEDGADDLEGMQGKPKDQQHQRDGDDAVEGGSIRDGGEFLVSQRYAARETDGVAVFRGQPQDRALRL